MLNRLLLTAATALTAAALTPGAAYAAPGHHPPTVGGPGRAWSLDVSDCASMASVNGVHHHPNRHHRRVRMVVNQSLAGNDMITVCLDPAGRPATYLNLRATGQGHNYSQYTAGGASAGTDVTTWYSKIRIDPVPVQVFPLTFRANIADQTFTRSTGLLCHGGTVSGCASGSLVRSMPYAVAFSCDAQASGRADLDLRGTPFRPVNNFALGGSGPSGTTQASGWQRLDLTGGGFCGWNAAPGLYNPFNTAPAGDANQGWDLQLRLAGL